MSEEKTRKQHFDTSGRTTQSVGTRVVRRKTDLHVYIYEITEAELHKLSSTSLSDIFLNFFVAALTFSISTTFAIDSSSGQMDHSALWLGLCGAGWFLSVFLLVCWLMTRSDRKKILKSIEESVEKVSTDSASVVSAHCSKPS
jgi:hypothetical protein